MPALDMPEHSASAEGTTAPQAAPCSSTSTQPAPTPLHTLALLSASQPDLVRSVQKDEVYIQQVVDACHEAARRLLGPLNALQYARESKLLALLLYHGLTTGSGLQTLGEEYCNLLQVTGAGTAPSLRRRLWLVLLQSLGPYLADVATARIEREIHAGDLAATGLPMVWEDEREGSGEAGGSSSSRGRDAEAGAGPGSRVLATATSALQPLRSWLIRSWPKIRPTLQYGARLHLALFYCFGVYYHLSHRLAGMRYASTSRPLQGRSSYAALGVMLVAQLALTSLLHLRHSAKSLPMQSLLGVGGAAAGAAGASGPRHAVLLEDEGEDADADGATAAAAAREHSRGAQSALEIESLSDVNLLGSGSRSPGSSTDVQQQQQQQQQVLHGSRSRAHHHAVPIVRSWGVKQCPLCLSPRRHPTATPCGHVFCWECVTTWCCEKPECPLCRSRVLPTQLVALYHSTF